MRLVHSAILSGLLLLAGSAHAVVCRVTPTGSQTSDGSDWGAQAMDFRTALSDGNCTELWVASGVYKPSTNGNRTTSFLIHRNGIRIYGGFAGTETALAERVLDPANPSILSGDIDGNDINTDGNQIAESWTDIQGSNSYHVIHVDGTGVDGNIWDSTLIDGFVVTGGQADGSANDGSGGGLYCSGNGAGRACNPTLSNVIFIGNRASHFGGAMCNDGDSGDSSPVLTRVTFTGNHADNAGGAIFNFGVAGNSSPSLSNVTFSGNSTTGQGGAMHNYGNSGNSSPVLRHVTFSGNDADAYGGALFNDGTAGNSTPQLDHVILWGDSATLGAEIVNSSATPTIRFSVLEGGCAGIGGAAAVCDNVIDGDPLLGPLQANDGFTPTLLPGAGSTAIDTGEATTCLSSEPDQRGVLRPQGAGCDIGSVEVVPVRNGGCRVNDDAPGPAPGDGVDWNTAYHDIHVALRDLSCPEIWVAAGVYRPTTGANRYTSFVIDRDGTRLYGGFAGTESTRAARDPKTNLSVLSGDIDANDTNDDGNQIAEVWTDIKGSNSHHVVTVDATTANGNITASTVIDGFTITGGEGVGPSPYGDGSGGGLYCDGSDRRTCSPTLSWLVFSGNRSYQGGALYNNTIGGTSSPELNHITFRGNAAVDGGAVYNYAGGDGTSSPTLNHVSFIGNTSYNNGGAIYSYAGGFGHSSPLLTNVTFSGNHAGTDGGAMFNDGSTTFSTSSPVLNHVTFVGNSANRYGGAISNDGYNGEAWPKLHNVILWGQGNGGDIANFFSLVSANDSVIQSGCGGISHCSNVITTDPLLGPLQDNGGSTLTMKPGVGSSAIDAADDTTCAPSDQRDLPRPQGARCDIGAVEVAPTVSVIVNGAGSVSADSLPASLVDPIIDCSASDMTYCSAEYPETSEVRLLLTPDASSAIDTVSGCGGSLAGDVFTTAPVSGDCTVTVNFVQLSPDIFANGFE